MRILKWRWLRKRCTVLGMTWSNCHLSPCNSLMIIVQIINHLCTHLKNSEAMAVDMVVKTAEVSTAKLVKELKLDASDTSFENFWKFVNDKCFLALDTMYGEFTSFTGPILTQSTLSKTTLPKHYHSISTLLNRSKYFNEKRFVISGGNGIMRFYICSWQSVGNGIQSFSHCGRWSIQHHPMEERMSTYRYSLDWQSLLGQCCLN